MLLFLFLISFLYVSAKLSRHGDKPWRILLFMTKITLIIRKARSKNQSVKEVLGYPTTRKTPPVPICIHGRKSIKFGCMRRFLVFFNLFDRAYACFVKNYGCEYINNFSTPYQGNHKINFLLDRLKFLTHVIEVNKLR